MQTTDDYLWFDNRTDEKLVRERIEEQAKTIKRLTISNQAFLQNGLFHGLLLPELQELVIPSLFYFDNSKGWQFLHSLPKLEILVAEYTEAKDSILEGLSTAPWWESLTQLELKLANLKETTKWSTLWCEKNFQLKILCLFYLDPEKAEQVLTGTLDKLEYLIMGTDLGQDFLLKLAKKALPALADLDLSHSSMQLEETLKFLREPRPGLPKLERVRKQIASEERVEYYDWNGAAVDWGYRELSDSEIQKKYFKKTGLKILPANEQLASRTAMMSGSLRKLERPQ